MVDWINLPEEPALAVDILLQTSNRRPVLLFKQSPICPASHAAEQAFRDWLRGIPAERPLAVALVDVIAQRGLARGITRAMDVVHESPQALLFQGGALAWHDSHGALTAEAFQREVFGCPAP